MRTLGTQAAYVLITPARNEASFIDKVIDSVASQSVRPLRWVIVDDGSTDATASIVQSRIGELNFLRLVNRARHGRRDFSSKALAFADGLALVADLNYQFVGNLDADICLPPEYYERMLLEFSREPSLGIAGGIVYTRVGERFLTIDSSPHSVGGAVQLFRRECFESIGGYLPLKHGGIDAAAEIQARMYGWAVRKFPDCKVTELRRTGTAQASPLRARMREGRRFHSLGYGFLFFVARAVFRWKDPPIFIGSVATVYGYLISYLKRERIQLPKEVVAFLRREQTNRLKKLVARLFRM